MQKKYSLSLHVFRRDLRLQDNSALIEALSSSDSVIPCFIFDKRQIEHNDYKSDNCIQFMAHSLQQLDAQLRENESKLYFFYGIAEEVIEQLIRMLKIDAVFINRDYTPFSRARDNKIAASCDKHGVDFHRHADALLHEPEQVLKSDQQPYTLFTPFFHKASQFAIAAARKNTHDNYYRDAISLEDNVILKKLLQKNNPNLLVKGGRQEALVLLKKMQNISDYKNDRNIPALAATSRLSAHNKFGTVSIRGVHAAIVKQFGSQHTLITELYWRDFFTHIAYHYPRVIGHAFQEKYAQLHWSKNENHFRAWCEGRTGFPIVDAGMRELNTTGYMHNRVRMIVASFLVKDLQIDWRWGEKYFAQKLVDYDMAVNNGNWQWAASTGCDAQPYFRIFNPWLQQQKFDPECLYIKRWVTELANIPTKIIHDLSKNISGLMTNYPHPIVDHAAASQKAKAMFKIR
jgi:deoxyribodipyrimidine photo-lyase